MSHSVGFLFTFLTMPFDEKFLNFDEAKFIHFFLWLLMLWGSCIRINFKIQIILEEIFLQDIEFLFFVFSFSTLNLIEDPLYVISSFPLAAFKILSLASDNLMIMCLDVDLLEFNPAVQ